MNIAFTLTLLHVGIFFGTLLVVFLVPTAIRIVKEYRRIAENNKEFLKRQKIVDDMKENGEFHDWVKMPVQGQFCHVCRNTGYCSELSGFVDVKAVKEYEKLAKTEQELKDFTQNQLKKIALAYSLDFDKLCQLREDMFEIKKTFYINKLEQLQNKLKKNTED